MSKNITCEGTEVVVERENVLCLPSMSTVTGKTSVWFVMVELYAAEPTSDI